MTIERLYTLTAENQTNVDLDVFAPSSPIAPVISSTKAHTGTYAYRCTSTTYAFGRNVGSRSTCRAAFWLNHNDLVSSGTASLFIFGQGGEDLDESPLLRVEWDEATSLLRIRRATAAGTYENIATASVPASLTPTDTWIHVAVTFYCHDTDGFLTLWVDGVAALTHTGDTRLSYWNGTGGGGSAQLFASTFSHIYTAGRPTAGANGFASFAYVDDIYVDSFDNETEFAPPTKRFLNRICNLAGVDSDWTPLASTNVSQIDDGEPNGGANDGDTTYNKAESADLRDTFGFDDIVLPNGYRVTAVIPYVHHKALDAGPEISLHLWDGANYADGDDQTALLAYTIELFERFTSMPDASDFTEADVNALQVGYRSRGSFA